MPFIVFILPITSFVGCISLLFPPIAMYNVYTMLSYASRRVQTIVFLGKSFPVNVEVEILPGFHVFYITIHSEFGWYSWRFKDCVRWDCIA